MRIIHVVNVRWFNATSWYGLKLASLMREQGHEVLVLTLEGTRSHERTLEMGLPVRTLPLNTTNPLVLCRLFADLARLIRDFKPDIINCHRGEATILFGLLRRLLGGFRLVRTRGDRRLPKANIFNRWLHTRAIDAVIVTNAAMSRHFRQRLGLGSHQLWRILGGVDRDRFRFDPDGRRRIRAEYGFGDDEVVVGLLGRFDWVKGQKQAIEAIGRLHAAGLGHLRLLLIGFGYVIDEETMRDWAAETGLEDAVAITGLRDDVTACICACDLAVAPSLGSEAIARAGLEFMSCSVPLIASATGVYPDLLEDEALVPPGDVVALADRLRKGALDESFRARLLESQSRTVGQLDDDEFLSDTLAVYTDILER
jgi:glycosyltransferase involved in cell wall biosynthesis